MMRSEHHETLLRTIGKIGIKDLPLSKIVELDYAGPEKSANVELYEKVNDLMKELLNSGKGLAECGYVTGEAGVLTGYDFTLAAGINSIRGGKGVTIIAAPIRYLFSVDLDDRLPFVSDEVFQNIKSQLGISRNCLVHAIQPGREWVIVGEGTRYRCIAVEGRMDVYFPLSNVHDAIIEGSEIAVRELLRWYRSLVSREDWIVLQWHEKFSVLYTMAYSINLYLLRKVHSPHFLFFGGQYALIQEDHLHGQPKKIWLLRGTYDCVREFASKLDEMKKTGAYVSHLVARKLLEISSPETLEFLQSLSDGGRSSHTISNNLLEDLSAVGFVQRTDCRECEITEAGRRFIEFVFPWRSPA